VTTLLGSYGAKGSISRAKFGLSILLDPNFRREAEFFSLKYSKSDKIWTVRWKRPIFFFRFQIFANGMGFGFWTRPLGLHTMTGQRLQVDYFNILFQPKGFSSRLENSLNRPSGTCGGQEQLWPRNLDSPMLITKPSPTANWVHLALHSRAAIPPRLPQAEEAFRAVHADARRNGAAYAPDIWCGWRIEQTHLLVCGCPGRACYRWSWRRPEQSPRRASCGCGPAR
jgi:hypothetical protein